MLKCVLFGHQPDEMWEYQRIGNRRFTRCDRCQAPLIHIVPADRPWPEGFVPKSEHEDEFLSRIIASIAPLLPKKRQRRVKVEPLQ